MPTVYYSRACVRTRQRLQTMGIGHNWQPTDNYLACTLNSLHQDSRISHDGFWFQLMQPHATFFMQARLALGTTWRREANMMCKVQPQHTACAHNCLRGKTQHYTGETCTQNGANLLHAATSSPLFSTLSDADALVLHLLPGMPLTPHPKPT